MNNLIEMLEQSTERTPEQSEALYMHEQLIIHRQMIGVGLANLCRDLKEIRDRKLYIPLGYDDFGAYTEQEHGIKQRMAYNYIATYEKLGVEILQSNAKLGITKLLQIATLDRDEREELLAEHSTDELADMSSEEVKRLTEQVKKLEEQISFLETEKENAPMPREVVQQPFDELQAEIRADVEREFGEERTKLEQTIASLEMKVARSVSDDELKKYRENAEKEAKAAAKVEMQDIKAKLNAANSKAKENEERIKNMQQKLSEAENAKKEADEKAQKAREFEEKLKAQEEANAALEKRIRAASDPEFERFKFLFEAWQKSTAELKAQLEKVGEDKQDKLKAAIKKVCEVNEL